MLLLIIGQNAIGKSVYIKNEANKALENNKDVLFNGWDRKYLNNKKYNEARLEALHEILDADEIIDNVECLAIKTSTIPISQNLVKILTLICKEGNCLYLDEPEYGLNNREIGVLVAFIYKIINTFETIEIVTHSELFFGITEAKVKTVKVNSEGEYSLSEVGENIYDTID